MGADVGLSISFVCGFLLVLARVSGAIVFVPIPGVAASPEPVRAVFALSLTMALAPFWPAVAQAPPVGTLLAWLAGEASLGLAIGLVISFLEEGFTMFGQLVGMQAGYSFASIIDPFSQADSGVCIVLAQTMAGLLFLPPACIASRFVFSRKACRPSRRAPMPSLPAPPRWSSALVPWS